MSRTGFVLWIVVAMVGAAFAATPARADTACAADIEMAVRSALPAAKPGVVGVHCGAVTESRTVNGRLESVPASVVAADVVLSDGRVATARVKKDEGGKLQVVGVTYQHADLVESTGWGVAVLFWVFALFSIAGALFVITRRNLIAAVMGMVGSFLGIAVIYMMLYAQFLAVIQMLVYAGAIMVLFVFVVMILNRPEDEPVAPSGRAGQVLGGVATLYLVVRLITTLTRVEPPNLEIAMTAPQPQCVTAASPCPEADRADWGSVKAVGGDLFGPGLFPFEAVSILLLVAVVGAIAIARPLRDDSEDSEDSGDASHAHGGAA